MSILEGDREVANPWMSGLRIDFKPCPFWSLVLPILHVQRRGRPSISADGYFGSLLALVYGSPNDVNQLAGIDLRLQLPFLRNTEIYAEYGGNDSGGTEFPEEWFGSATWDI